MTGHRIDVEFGLTIREVSSADLGPILESLTRLTQNGGALRMSKETREALERHAPKALAAAPEPRAIGQRTPLTTPRVIAALTAWQGDVTRAADALAFSPASIYNFCRTHGIKPAAFRGAPKEDRP